MELIWVEREGKYFCKPDWIGGISLIQFNKFTVARKSVKRATRRDRQCEPTGRANARAMTDFAKQSSFTTEEWTALSLHSPRRMGLTIARMQRQCRHVAMGGAASGLGPMPISLSN
jgi:hypothetical protein